MWSHATITPSFRRFMNFAQSLSAFCAILSCAFRPRYRVRSMYPPALDPHNGEPRANFLPELAADGVVDHSSGVVPPK